MPHRRSSGVPSRIRSTSSQLSIAAAVAAVVFIHTCPAIASAAPSEPTLNPNQPNHSSAAPSMTHGMLCGRYAILPKVTRRPTRMASTSAAIPALMCTTVPPAKSMGATWATVSPSSLVIVPNIHEAKPVSLPDSRPPPQTMWESGKYTRVAHTPANTSHVPNFTRSAIAPLMSATVMTANVSWKPTQTMAGTVPKPPITICSIVSPPSWTTSLVSSSGPNPNRENGSSKMPRTSDSPVCAEENDIE